MLIAWIVPKMIGPFSTTANIGTTTITMQAGAVTIIGTVTNCSAQPVTNGYVSILLDGGYYRTNISNGQFSIMIQRCNNTAANAEVYAVDVTANQQGSFSTLQITSSNSNAGALSACGISTAQYINYSINGNQYNLSYPNDSMMAKQYPGIDSSTSIFASSAGLGPSQNVSLNFTATNRAPGTYPLSLLYIFVGNTQYVKNGSANVSISEYGGFGQFVGGSINGSVRDSSNLSVTYPLSMTFRVRRIN